MDHGEVKERGNHAALIAAQGAYYDLYTAVEADEGERGAIKMRYQALPSGGLNHIPDGMIFVW